jgi:hypothetical protein
MNDLDWYAGTTLYDYSLLVPSQQTLMEKMTAHKQLFSNLLPYA